MITSAARCSRNMLRCAGGRGEGGICGLQGMPEVGTGAPLGGVPPGRARVGPIAPVGALAGAPFTEGATACASRVSQ